MDLSLFRTLQSVKAVENNNPEFQTQTIDYDTFQPKYPHVIIVDPKKTSQAGKRGLIQVKTLTEAIKAAVRYSPILGKCWSFILREGVYIDALSALQFISGSAGMGWSLEIVGLRNVRLLCLRSMEYGGTSGGVVEETTSLTLRNVCIYDLREESPKGHQMLFMVKEKAHLDMLNVRITSPNSDAVGISKAAKLNAYDCTFKKCHGAFLNLGGHVEIKKCQVSESAKECTGKIYNRGEFIASECQFVGGKSLLDVAMMSKCFIDKCQFKGFELNGDPVRKALSVQTGSLANCTRTSFKGFPYAVIASDSDTQIDMSKCLISKTEVVCMVNLNANATIVDNFFDTTYGLMLITQNVKGKVELKKNRFGPKMSRVILKDAISIEPSHDINRLSCVAALSEVEPDSPYSRRECSEYTEKFLSDAGESGIKSFKDPRYDDPRYKRCGRCSRGQGNPMSWRGQEQSEEIKFQYCSKCRSVCYCSKECQVAHWPDHKLNCRKLREKSKK